MAASPTRRAGGHPLFFPVVWHKLRGQVAPLWSKGGGRLLAVEKQSTRADEAQRSPPSSAESALEHLPVRALVYRSGKKLRRVELGSWGSRKRWEYRLSTAPQDGFCARLGTAVLVDVGDHALESLNIATGEPQWILHHDAPLAGAPLIRDDGDLLILLDGGRWLHIDPLSGVRREEGTFKSEQQRSRVTAGASPIVTYHRRSSLEGGWRAEGGRLLVREDHIALDDWQADGLLEEASEVVGAAVQVVELGRITLGSESTTSCVLDGLLILRCGDSSFAVDPRTGAIELSIEPNGLATIHGADGTVWRRRL